MRHWLLPFLALSLFLQAGGASALQIPTLGETIDVSIVNLEVFVTDKQGHRVRGLTSRDFEIYENGRLRPISNFAEYAKGVSAETEVGAAGPQVPNARQKRTIILFIDRFSILPQRAALFFAGVKKLVRETIQPGDAVTIVSWNRLLVNRLSLTSDVGAAEKVIDQIQSESSSLRFDPRPAIEAEREWLENASAIAGERGYEIDADRMLPVSGLEAATRARLDMRSKIESINSLMRGVSGLEGRKAMLLITHRFSRVAGKEFLIGGGRVDRMSRTEFLFDMQREISTIVKTANANGVTIYPIYPEGLAAEVGVRADARSSPGVGVRENIILDNENEGLTAVARGTGGLSEWGAENILRMLPRMQEDLDSYYSMAYRITSSGTDRSRSVVVKAKNRDYVVRSRREYVEKSDRTRMTDRVLATLLRGPQASSIDVRVRIGAVREIGRNRYSIPVTVRIPVASLMTLPQERENAGAFSVFIGWGNALGELGPVTEQRQRFRFSREEHDGALLAFHTCEVEVVADHLTDRIAVAVFDEVSKDYGLARIELPPREQMVLAKTKGK